VRLQRQTSGAREEDKVYRCDEGEGYVEPNLTEDGAEALVPFHPTFNCVLR
jgi:hypothetical protein